MSYMSSRTFRPSSSDVQLLSRELKACELMFYAAHVMPFNDARQDTRTLESESALAALMIVVAAGDDGLAKGLHSQPVREEYCSETGQHTKVVQMTSLMRASVWYRPPRPHHINIAVELTASTYSNGRTTLCSTLATSTRNYTRAGHEEERTAKFGSVLACKDPPASNHMFRLAPLH